MVRVWSTSPNACVSAPDEIDSSDPDLAAIQRIAAGDAGGCRVLMQRHLGKLHALASRLLGNAADADEVCQDAFLRAWKQAPGWQTGGARFSTWLHQVVLNLCRDRLRGRREQVSSSALDALVDGHDPEQRASARDSAAHVRDAVRELPERQRDALLLVHFQGLSNIEAARIMEVSVDALESLLARARRSLKERLSTLYDAGTRNA